METKVSKAWLLRTKDLEEHDALATFLFEDGRIVTLKCLGIRKPNSKNRQMLQSFSIIELEYFQTTNKNTGKLKRANLDLQTLPKQQSDLNKLNLIKNLIIFYKKVDKIIFLTVAELVKDVQYKSIPIEAILYIMVKLLKNENILINTSSCVKCGRKDRISSFSLYEGGLLCSKHITPYDKKYTGSFLRKVITLFETNKLADIYELKFDFYEEAVMKEMFETFFSENLGLYPDLLKKI